MLWHLAFRLIPHSPLLLHSRLCAFCISCPLPEKFFPYVLMWPSPLLQTVEFLFAYRNNQGISVSYMGFPPFLLTLSYFPPSPRTIRQAAYFPCSSASCLSLLGGQSLSLTVNSLSRRWCSAHHRHSVCICWLAEGMREWKHNCTDV